MKALILNSGTGSRMGDIKTCKCLVEITPGKTIVDEQIRRLTQCGISNICMTTGPYAEKLETYLRSRYSAVNFKFVHNPLYNETNYIYSIFLAREYLQEDILLMHGDLVFEIKLLREALSFPNSCMVIDTTKPLPEKDFKSVIKDGIINSVGVNFFESAVYAQPLYKLLWQDWRLWLDEIERFCQKGNTDVYAEDALNNLNIRLNTNTNTTSNTHFNNNNTNNKINIFPLDARGKRCFEIDNADDLTYARDVYKKCN